MTHKINLVITNDCEGNPFSFDQTLLMLIGLLETPTQELVQALGEIGSVLYKRGPDHSNELLIPKYSPSIDFINQLPPLIEKNGLRNYLFTLNSMRIINKLLISDVGKNLILPIEIYTKNNQLPIFQIFFLANQIVSYLDNQFMDTEGIVLKDAKVDYSRNYEDTNSSIGRSCLLYDSDYFKDQISEKLGFSLEDLSKYLFVLFTLVNVHEPAKIELEHTFKVINDNIDRENIVKILKILSVKIKNKKLNYSDLKSGIHQDYVHDSTSRGKPFLQIGNRFICIRPDLLTSAFGNFPYHYLLNNILDSEKEKLFNEFGKSFDNYIEKISIRAVKEGSCEYFYSKKPHKGNRCSDRHIKVNDQCHVIIEIKSSRENDAAMLGIRNEIIDKFIHMDGPKNKLKGAMQLVNDVIKFRQDSSFKGKIYPILLFYGNFPKVSEFDDLVQKEIVETDLYREYLEDKNNMPIIWLNSYLAELFFNTILQKNSLTENLVDCLSKAPPSDVRTFFQRFLEQHTLNSSLSCLFRNELKVLQEASKKMIDK